MKVVRMVLVMFICTGLTIVVLAQTRLIANSNAKISNLPSPAPASGIGIVDSGEFTEQKTGITKVVAALAKLDVKYQGVNKELQEMQTRLTNLRTDIQNKRLVQDPKITAQQTEQADQLELQIKRKAEDAQSSYQREMNTAVGPLQTDIGKALEAYAKVHGLSLIIDANRVPLIYVDASIDITKDFIAEYNKTHP